MKRRNKSRKNMRKNASKKAARSSVHPSLGTSSSDDIAQTTQKTEVADIAEVTEMTETSVKVTTSTSSASTSHNTSNNSSQSSSVRTPHTSKDTNKNTHKNTNKNAPKDTITTVARPWPVLPDDADYLKQDPILKTVSRAVFALVMLFALLLLWRGHNAPGGGFIAGLMTLCAFMLHRMANGHNVIRLDATMMVAIGMSLSFLTGLVPYLFGKSFLKSDYGYITTALTGEFEWATALLFDLGVYLVVVGAGSSITGSLHRIDPEELVEDDFIDERT